MGSWERRSRSCSAAATRRTRSPGSGTRGSFVIRITMSNTDKAGLVEKQRLTDAELAELAQLAQFCDAYDHATLRFNWDTLAARREGESNDFFYYENGMLVGALA